MKKFVALVLSVLVGSTSLAVSAGASSALSKSAVSASFTEVIEDTVAAKATNYYEFTISEKGELSFFVDGFGILDNSQAVIYNSSSKALKTVKSLYLDSNRSFSLDVSKDTYYLGIKSDKERSFEVTPSFTPSSQAEASDSDGKGTTAIKGFENALEPLALDFGFDEIIKDKIKKDDVNYYSIEIPEAGELSLYFDGFSSFDSASVTIFDKNAKAVHFASSIGMAKNNTIAADVKKGVYYIAVKSNTEREFEIVPSLEPSHTPMLTLSLSVKKGKTITLGTVLNTQNDKVTWKSANSKIAAVSSKGKIKGIKKGTTTITATTKSGIEMKIQIKVS